MQGQEEAKQTCSGETEAEMKALRDELQLALKKEREAQVFVNLPKSYKWSSYF